MERITAGERVQNLRETETERMMGKYMILRQNKDMQ